MYELSLGVGFFNAYFDAMYIKASVIFQQTEYSLSTTQFLGVRAQKTAD